MSGLAEARCVGKFWLFDSTQLSDHEAAAELCATCPALAACTALLREVQTETSGTRHAGGGPVGTWAGRLLGRTGVRREPVNMRAHNGVIRGSIGAQVKSGPSTSASTLDPGLTPVLNQQNGG